jgi:hypothetical protein
MHTSQPAEHAPAYDLSLCVTTSGDAEARRLMARAFKGALTLLQQQTLLGELERDPSLVYHLGLTPTKVSSSFYLSNLGQSILCSLIPKDDKPQKPLN